MNLDATSLLRTAQIAMRGAPARRVERLLDDPATRFVAMDPSREVVDQLLPTLRARLANAQRSGTHIDGLDQVISRLETLEPGARVLGYGVVSSRSAANVYFTEG